MNAFLTIAAVVSLMPMGCAKAVVEKTAGPDIPAVTVDGPTLIAFFPPVSQGEVDAAGDLAEALSDFQFHLERARGRLEAAGIKVHELYTRQVDIREGSESVIFDPMAEAQGEEIGYYLALPGRPPMISFGVGTDSDILTEAAVYFGIPALRTDQVEQR
jgi:hypothetical protein